MTREEFVSNFKQHPIYKNYLISSDGEVFSRINKRILKQDTSNKGYKRVQLTISKGITKKVSVHTLVLETFIRNRPEKHVCNHKNGIKNDNKLSNLEWTTMSENIKHAYKTGLKTSTDRHKKAMRKAGKESGKKLAKLSKLPSSRLANSLRHSKHSSEQIFKMKDLFYEGYSQKKICSLFNISKASLSLLKNKKTYQWFYKANPDFLWEKR